MELHVIKRNGKLIYIITDNKGVAREVTLDYVKFAIENHDLPEYFINDAGEVFLPSTAFMNCPKQYMLVGRMRSETGETSYLLNRLMDKHMVKANYATLSALTQRAIVAGAMINSRNELCTSIKLDEYVIKQVNGKSTPVKVTSSTAKKLTSLAEKPELTLSLTFASLLDQLSAFEKTITHTDTDNTDVRRKYPELYEMSAKGTVLQLDNNVKLVLDIVNLQDLVADIATEAKLRMYVDSTLVEVTITDTDYRLSSIYFVQAAYEAYKALFNKYAKLQTAIISNIDTHKSYWTIEFNTLQKIEQVKTSTITRTRSDVLTLQDMYDVERSDESVMLTEQQEKQLLQGLKLGTSYILINGAEQFISTSYRLNLVEKTLGLTLKNSNNVEIIFDFKGKTVQTLNATKICLIAATGVANRQLITSISIINDSINVMFTLQFTPKQSFTESRRQDIISSLT